MEVLHSMNSIIDTNNQKLDSGILSDTHRENEELSEDEKINRKNKVLEILESNNIKQFFEPVDLHLTLSTDLGFTKSKDIERFFKNALSKISDDVTLRDIIFVTEEKEHIYQLAYVF